MSNDMALLELRDGQTVRLPDRLNVPLNVMSTFREIITSKFYRVELRVGNVVYRRLKPKYIPICSEIVSDGLATRISRLDHDLGTLREKVVEQTELGIREGSIEKVESGLLGKPTEKAQYKVTSL